MSSITELYYNLPVSSRLPAHRVICFHRVCRMYIRSATAGQGNAGEKPLWHFRKGAPCRYGELSPIRAIHPGYYSTTGNGADNAIWREASRMFSTMKSPEYVHPPYTVDDATGIYRFDFLGFVDHVLINADAPGYKTIGKG